MKIALRLRQSPTRQSRYGDGARDVAASAFAGDDSAVVAKATSASAEAMALSRRRMAKSAVPLRRTKSSAESLRPARIAAVQPGSPAARQGLRPGDRLIAVNGTPPRDYIEYRFLAAEDQVDLVVRRGESEWSVSVTKHPDEDLGLRFAGDVFDRVLTCRCRCEFCFLDQLPPGLQPSLRVRDDDYRLSFLHGNFITLSNLSQEELNRIKNEHLSPLYVSVHSTDSASRGKLMGRRRLPPILPRLRELTEAGIEIHAQIVLCPGRNDGAALDRTLADLAPLFPGVRTVGVVPVGLTAHREGLADVPPVTPAVAAATVDQLRAWQAKSRRKLRSRFVWPSDELYLLAGVELPSAAAYEGFPQLSNGIGSLRLFVDETAKLPPVHAPAPRRIGLVTGRLAADAVRRLGDRIAGKNLAVEVVVVTNRLFGERITVAGLLAGRDIFAALRERDPGDAVILPATCLKEGELFLDDFTRTSLATDLGVPVLAASSPLGLVETLRSAEIIR